MIVILLSTQRSGTNLLRSILSTHANVDALFGEVFDPGYIDNQWSFFCFLQRIVKDDCDAWLPGKRREIFLRYLSELDAAHEKEVKIVDVKYNSTHHLRGWWNVGPDPLLKIARDEKIKVIHLIRSDLLGTIISQAVASATGVYVSKREPRAESPSIRLDPNHVRTELPRRRGEILHVRSQIKQMGVQCLEIYYEDIMEPDYRSVAPRTVSKLSEFLSVDSRFDGPSTRKLVKRPPSETIENYAAIQAVLDDLGYEIESSKRYLLS